MDRRRLAATVFAVGLSGGTAGVAMATASGGAVASPETTATPPLEPVVVTSKVGVDEVVFLAPAAADPLTWK